MSLIRSLLSSSAPLAAMLCWSLAGASTPTLDRTCLDGSDRGNGLALAVDTVGDVHLSHVDRVTGDWLYTRIGTDRAPETVVLRVRVATLLAAEVEDTGIAVGPDGTVWACVVDRRRSEAVLMTGRDGQWAMDVLDADIEGDGCDVAFHAGTVWVAWQSDGRLRVAHRPAGGGWIAEVADAPAGRAVGGRPSIDIGADGRVGVAHRDLTDSTLRLTARSAGGDWLGFGPASGWPDGGFEPHIVFAEDGRAEVFHGIANANRNQETDPGLLRTVWDWPDAAETTLIDAYGLGGSVGAARGSRGRWATTRQFARSALFGNDDGLYVISGEPLDADAIEQYGPADARHRLEYVRIAVDPFGLPVVAFLDDIGPFRGDPGRAPVCVRRPIDTDADRVPDDIEVELGTDPASADSDGDGRSDGEEVLIDGTDPTGGACPEPCCDGVPCPEGLVPDGEMEAADPWPRDRGPACAKSADAAWSGARGLHCGPGGGDGRQTGIALAPDTLYRLRIRHRVVSGTLYGFLGTRADGVFTAFEGTSLTASAGAWSTHWRVFRTPADLDRTARLIVSATDEAYVDDVAIEALADDDSLVANGDVEDPTGAWVRYSANGCVGIEGDAYNGIGALSCGPGRAGARVPKLPLRADALHRLRYAWRADDAPLYGWFGIRRPDGVFEEVRGSALRAYVPSDGWRLFERIVRTPIRPESRYELAFYADGRGLVDDLTLHALPDGASLIADGGFEGPQVAGWSRYGATACTITDAAYAGGGAASCRGAQAGLRQPHIPAQPGALYRLDAAFAVQQGSLAMQIGVQSAAGFERLPGTSLTAFPAEGWRLHAATLQVPDPLEGDLRVVLVSNGEAQVDAVSLTPLAAADDRLADGGFERGGAGWRRYSGAACDVVDGAADTGDRHLRCAGRQGMQTNAPVEAGAAYRLEGRVAVSAGGLYVFVGPQIDGVFDPVPGGSRFIGPTDGWIDYRLDFDGPDAPDFRVIVYADGEAEVDGFALRPR